MKKRLLAATSVIMIPILAVLSLRCWKNDLPCSWLGTRAYLGYRFEAELYITIDEKPALLEKTDSSAYVIRNENGCYVLKHRADNYEMYDYHLVANGKIPITLHYEHFNWWEITRTRLYIDIDTSANEYTVYETYSYTSEEFSYSLQSVKDEPRTLKGINSIDEYVGP